MTIESPNKIYRQPTLRTGKWNETACFEGKVYDRKMKFAFVVFEDINPGAGYVMAHLKKQGHEVRLFFDPKQGNRGYAQNKLWAKLMDIQNWLIKEMKAYKPDIACFSVLSATYQDGVKFAERVKKEVKDDNGNPVHIIFGGTMPTLVPEVVSENWFIDEIVQGDGVRHFGGQFNPDELWAERQAFFDELPPEHRHTQLFMTSYGCPYNCTFCLPSGTLILDEDLNWRSIDEYNKGDKVIGVENDKYAISNINKIFKRKDYLWEIKLSNDDRLLSTAEHPWYAKKKGNKYDWVETKDLEEGYILKFISSPPNTIKYDSDDYKIGYIKGVMMGDGSIGVRKIRGMEFKRFQLVTDDESLDAFQVYCEDLGIMVHERRFNGGKYFKVDRCLVVENKQDCERLQIIRDCLLDNEELKRGFLAGVYDSEGSWSCNILRICNTNISFKDLVVETLRWFGFECKIEGKSVIVYGGQSKHLELLSLINNHVLKRRKDIFGKSINSKNGEVRVVSVIKTNEYENVFNFNTSTGNFIANGYLTHNCGNQQLREVGQYVKLKRTVDGCIKELTYLKEKWGMKNVLFVDDILTLDKKWLMEFLPLYREKVNCPFACFGHVNCMDEEQIAEMAKSNCKTIWLGIQSGCPRHRKEILDRPETNEQIIKVSEWIKKYGIKLMVDHISGLPYESDLTHELSYSLYEKIKADVINVYECLYFPKAKINEHALECGYLQPSDIDKINRGQHVIYQQGNHGHKYYDKYSKAIVSLPLGGAAWELLPMPLIKLIVHLRAGRGYIANAMIENELYFTWKAILKKTGLWNVFKKNNS